MIVVLIGVTGCGKSTVGKQLAAQLGWIFLEGDDFHPPANVEKLRRGVPLSDGDRIPWLKAIREVIRKQVNQRENAVIACSALKKSYRRMLRISSEVKFVYLKASIPLIESRFKKRRSHFMNPALIQSQFDILDEPKNALWIDASLPPSEIPHLIRSGLGM
jgi:gluconokinase